MDEDFWINAEGKPLSVSNATRGRFWSKFDAATGVKGGANCVR